MTLDTTDNMTCNFTNTNTAFGRCVSFFDGEFGVSTKNKIMDRTQSTLNQKLGLNMANGSKRQRKNNTAVNTENTVARF